MASRIVVHRTHIAIHDYNLGDKYYLERELSIWDKIYFKALPIGYIYDDKNKILRIPRGVSVTQLEKMFNLIAEIDYSFDEIRKFSKPITLKYTPRDEDQIEAIRFILSMGKYKNNTPKSMLSINLNTGKGKTYCSIASIAYMGVKSIIISPLADLMDQWYNFFLEYTDIDPEKIYFISGTPTIQKLYMRTPDDYDVYICSHGTLQSYGNTYGWDKVGELFKYLGIGMKFFDEAHLNFENMFYIDCFTNTFKSYYLTATMGRSDREQDSIFQLYFAGTPSIDLFDKDVDPHTKYVAIKYNSHPSPMDIQYCRNAYSLDRNKYTNYVVEQPNFEKMLYILMEKALAKQGKCLWYIGTNDAILKVRDWIYEHYPSMIGNVGIYTSIVTDQELKAQQLEKKIILSTTKSAGAAMDIKGLVETVNLAEPFKSRVLAQQTLGRTRADNTIYKEVVDLGFDQTRRYYNFKKPIFSKYATSCSEVILNEQQLTTEAQKIIDSRKKLWCPVLFEDNSNIGK